MKSCFLLKKTSNPVISIMKNLIIFIILFLNFSPVIAQEIEILKKSDSIPIIKEKGLVYINEKTALTDFHFIAKLKITSNDFNELLTGLQNLQTSYRQMLLNTLKKKI